MGTTVFERVPPSPSALEHSLRNTALATFWLDEIDRADHPPLVASARADLVVVGGGYTGLWTALRAKERDPSRQVILLEAGQIGWAASGRNGGFCDASLTHGFENGLSRWPQEIDTLERLGRENLEGIEATIAAYGIDAEFERVGALDVATEPHQVPWLAEYVAQAKARGVDGVELLDESATRAQVHSPTYLGAVWRHDDTALVHPAKLAVGLARVAADLGVVIHEYTRVRGIESSGRGVVLDVGDHRVHAQQVALATNVFPSLLRRNALMTVPVYDYALMTEPLTGEQLAAVGWRNRQGVGDVANQFHYYRLSADNRILFGGYDAVYFYGRMVDPAHEDNPDIHRKLASHFLTTFPQLEGISFTHRWAGAIDSSTRFCAFYGLALGKRVAYAAGFTGLGVAATRFGADVMLDLLAGEQTERTALEMVRTRPMPFPVEPIAALGINATRWSMDRADHHEGRRNLMLRGLDALGLGFDS